jgi:hypothetical protein
MPESVQILVFGVLTLSSIIFEGTFCLSLRGRSWVEATTHCLINEFKVLSIPFIFYEC